MMSKLAGYGLGCLICAVASVGPAMANIIFSDGIFDLGTDYTAAGPFSNSLTASLAVAQCASCGVSGSGLQTVATFTSSPVGTLVNETIINTTFSYDPQTQGAIVAIDASVDKNIFTTLTGTGFGNTFRPTIEQSGVYYESAIPGSSFDGPNDATTPGYASIAGVGLLATNFISFDPSTGATGPAHPDFAGATLLFGLTQNSGTAGTGTLTTQYDNLTFVIRSVPEPGSLALLGTALTALVLIRRRHREL